MSRIILSAILCFLKLITAWSPAGRKSKLWVLIFLGLQLHAFNMQASSSKDSLPIFNEVQLGFDYIQGIVLPHHSSISYNLEKPIRGFEFALSTQSYGRTPWDCLYRYPRYGAGFLHTSLGNEHVFGSANALLFFMEIPFSTESPKITFHYNIALGPSYVTRVFNVHNNPLNVSMSSAINLFFRFKMHTQYKINHQGAIDLGLSFMHVSNGKVTAPNQGLNASAFSLGYRHQLNSSGRDRILQRKVIAQKKHGMEIALSGGYKADEKVSLKKYMISSLVLDYKYGFASKYAYGAGLDLFYDGALGVNKVANEGGSYKSSDLVQLGIHGAFHVHYSKINTILQLGSYLYASYLPKGRIYTRLGIRYEILPNTLLCFSLKSHKATADFLEWGVAYRL